MNGILCHFGDVQGSLVIGCIRNVVILAYEGLIRVWQLLLLLLRIGE